MNTYEDLVKGKSLDELLKEAKQGDLKKEMALVRVKDNQQIITVGNNKDLLLRIKNKKENVVFERFYNELPRHDNQFGPTVCYLLNSFGCYVNEVSLLHKLGKAYYSLQAMDYFLSVFNLLADCDSSLEHLLNTAYSPLADYDSFAVQFQDVFNSYEHFLPRLLPLKIGMKVRTVIDELTKKKSHPGAHYSFPNGSIREVVGVYDNNARVRFSQKSNEENYVRHGLEIIELDPRNVDALAWEVLRRNIEEKFARMKK